jgi:hypothetical protein
LLFYAYYDRETPNSKKIARNQDGTANLAERWRQIECCLDRSGKSSRGSISNWFFPIVEMVKMDDTLRETTMKLHYIRLQRERLIVRTAFAAAA